MTDHEETERAIRLLLQKLGDEVTDAKKDLHGFSTDRWFAMVAEIAALKACAIVQRDYAREMALRDGVEEGRGVQFAWRSNAEYRRAEVYPNAHNDGETFGLVTATERHGSGEVFHGAGWTRVAALAAAKAWVNDGVRPGGNGERVKATAEGAEK